MKAFAKRLLLVVAAILVNLALPCRADDEPPPNLELEGVHFDADPIIVGLNQTIFTPISACGGNSDDPATATLEYWHLAPAIATFDPDTVGAYIVGWYNEGSNVTGKTAGDSVIQAVTGDYVWDSATVYVVDLQYSSIKGATRGIWYLANGIGCHQTFRKRYYATLIGCGGSGWTISQSTTIVQTFVNAADATPRTPQSFSPPVCPTGFNSTANGNTVTTVIPNDYGSDRRYGITIPNSMGDPQITDRPGCGITRTADLNLRISHFSFTGQDTVPMAPGVQGTITMQADFDWTTTPPTMTWTATSSDGRVNESGHYP